jgi:hypothetical protein
MHVFQTAGVPPKRGVTILPTIGCTRNSRKALVNRANEKINNTGTAALRD